MLKHETPDFVMHTGDLVADGNDSGMWPVFFDIERELLRKSAFFPRSAIMNATAASSTISSR